ncbi:MAG: riboflavin synthase subunit alpha [Candidatus Melainabacteria bacterium RIFCSPLOWO2_02_FULL_35_15]|nr:MAG: riboflavin synthase subunit alpha [Candidatus Melainabacteria bacterium RIFCSPLOWO2_12_FULL_35_11]OGI14232.1 MAG: riboflavin synthase subunit alpha [Candidatus Melainabacteria bacterium RIFCSPLOWO2_02_FULL_35_15]
MFSGIVQEIGIIKDIGMKNRILELTISSKHLINDLKIGSSIAVNGCCLTVVECSPAKTFKVQVTEETLKKTNFLNLKSGLKVNLESSLKLGETIDGHLVSGHIDTVGEVSDICSSGENKIIKISYSSEYGKYIAPKGSISVNGVSLTIIESKNDKFDFTLIPFTRDNTNLGLLKAGDLVNLEIDLISRYVVNALESTRQEIKLR